MFSALIGTQLAGGGLLCTRFTQELFHLGVGASGIQTVCTLSQVYVFEGGGGDGLARDIKAVSFCILQPPKRNME